MNICIIKYIIFAFAMVFLKRLKSSFLFLLYELYECDGVPKACLDEKTPAPCTTTSRVLKSQCFPGVRKTDTAAASIRSWSCSLLAATLMVSPSFLTESNHDDNDMHPRRLLLARTLRSPCMKKSPGSGSTGDPDTILCEGSSNTHYAPKLHTLLRTTK